MATSWFWSLAVALDLISTSALPAAEVIRKREFRHLTEVAYLATAAEFSETLVIQLASKARATHSTAVLKVYVFVDKTHVLPMITSWHLDFEAYRNRCLALANSPAPAAEVVFLESEGVMQIRDGLSATRKILGSRDPLTARANGTQCTVEFVNAPGGAPGLELFVRCSGKLSQALANQLNSSWWGTPLRYYAFMVVRNDAEFAYPGATMPCLWGKVRPSSESGHSSRPQMRCSSQGSLAPDCKIYPPEMRK